MMPGPCSIAINTGNPADLTNAQNAPILGIRDIGAAEQTSATPSYNISTTQINNTITSNEPNSNYQWLDCDNNYAIITGETNISFTPTTDGNYAVNINNGICSDTSACVNINTIGISSSNTQFQNIKLYPNPTSNEITINLKNHSNINVSIINLFGVEIYKKSNITDSQLNVSLSNFKQGVYFVKIQGETKKKIIKLIKK